MSQDPYGGDIRNPASLHRYRYASGNPVNRIDPSGRNDTTEMALGISWTAIQGYAAIYALGKSINCIYESEASAVRVLNGPQTGAAFEQLLSLRLDEGTCAASAVFSGFALGGMAYGGLQSLLADTEPFAMGAAGAYTDGAPWLDNVTNYTKGGTFLQCGQTCVSATGQNLTGGAVSEQQLAQLLGQPARNPLALANALNGLGSSGQWAGQYFANGEAALDQAEQGLFGAVLQAPGVQGHMVAIEPIVGTNMFLVMDTGAGATYEVTASWIEQFVSGGVWQVTP
jgi:hypothetical protein